MKKISLFLCCVIALTMNAQTITHFDTTDGLIAGIPSSIMEDTNGSIWCSDWSEANSAGIANYDGTAWSSFSNADGAPSNAITSTYQDANGLYWFTTFDDLGVSSFDGTNWTNYTTANGLVNNTMWDTREDSQGNYWFSGVGISMFDGTSFINYPTINGSAFVATSMVEDSNGDLWFPTSLGLVKFDGTDFTVFTTADGFSSDSPTAVFIDDDENLWVGSYDETGIDKFDGTTVTTYSFSDGIANVRVRYSSAIMQASDGRIYFGTNYGIAIFDGTDWDALDPSDGLLDAPVRAILEDQNGVFWIGHFLGVTSYNPVLSVSNSLLDTYTVFPNPVEQVLYITAITNIQTVEIYSQLGTLVTSKKGTHISNIDVSHIASGVYHLKATNAEGLIGFKKIVIQ